MNKLTDCIKRLSMITKFNEIQEASEDQRVKDVIGTVIGIILLEPPAANVVEIPPKGMGSLSDGYHTFDELYRHRGILFAMICADHPDIAWKSLKHHDGTMYPGMFICCIDTPYGQASYHMDLDPFWNLIQVRELDAAPEWDGHTPDMALNRIAAMAADRFVPIEGGVVED